jgi:hypothetical protein
MFFFGSLDGYLNPLELATGVEVSREESESCSRFT